MTSATEEGANPSERDEYADRVRARAEKAQILKEQHRHPDSECGGKIEEDQRHVTRREHDRDAIFHVPACHQAPEHGGEPQCTRGQQPRGDRGDSVVLNSGVHQPAGVAIIASR